jgi:thioredoxin 1
MHISPSTACRMIKPMYEELAKQYENQITFGKVDVDENQEAAMKFEVQAVPTFVLFDGESAVERFSGADAARLQKLLKDLADR